jgi:hypothetical protein
MQQKILKLGIVLFLPLILFGQPKEVDSFKLFYLGGQSNMDGYGFNSELPDSLNKEFKDIWIFHGNTVEDDSSNGGLGIWETLKPGHGVGFSSDGNTNALSDRFGVELSFAKRLSELYPNEKIAIIKYSRGGTSIDSMAAAQFGSWEPDYRGLTGINQYDHFLATIRNALAVEDINSDGKRDQFLPFGIIWMQGESDAMYTEEIALRYYSNLKRLMDLIRASLHKDDLPVVIGKISDSFNDTDGKVWDFGEIVQYAQEKYAKTDGNAAIIRSTKFYDYSDPWHYDSAGFIDLGKNFADAIFLLNNSTK